MTSALLAGLLLASSTPLATPFARPAPPADPIQFAEATVTFHSRVVIRFEADHAPPVTNWVEKKGPHCINLADIQASAVIVPNSVDLALHGGSRVRMRFERSCPGLDYYSGYYLVPNKDGKVCLGRDVVRDRAGGECAIDKFRKLIPAK